MNDFFSAWKSQIYDVSKGKYWTHTDGSKWWHNPDTDKIEPYNPESHPNESHIDVTQVTKYKDAFAIANIPHGSLMPVLFAARLMVNHVKAGMSKQDAMTLAAQYVKKSISANSNLEDLYYRHQAFVNIGLGSISTIVAERYYAVEVAEAKKVKEQHNVEPKVQEPEVQPEPQKPESTVSDPVQEKPVEQPKPEPIPDDGGYDKKMLYQEKELKYKHLPQKLGGSTGAYLVEITDGEGQKEVCVVKEYHGNYEQVRNEHFANTLYRAFTDKDRFGHVDLGIVTMDNGNKALITRYIPDLVLGNELSSVDKEKVKSRLHTAFVVDAWLANWDVVGLSDDNIGLDPINDRVVKFDNGGALEFRAQGSPKGDAFGDKVTELDTMRDPNKAPSAAKWFGDIPDDQLVYYIENFADGLKSIGAAGFQSIAQRSGYSPKEAYHICEKLMNRANSIIEYGKNLSKKNFDMVLNNEHRKSNWPNLQALEKAASDAYDNELSSDERFAVDYYTEAGSYSINRALVAGVKNQRIVDLKKALAKLPGFSGLSMRGVQLYNNAAAHFAKWKSGEWSSCEWTAFTSTSVRPGSQFGSDEFGMSFIILNKGISGGYIGMRSNNSNESELLLAPGSQHRVVGVCERGGYDNDPSGKFYRCVILEEMPSSDFEKLPPSQEPPKQWDYQELMTFVKSNSIPNPM